MNHLKSTFIGFIIFAVSFNVVAIEFDNTEQFKQSLSSASVPIQFDSTLNKIVVGNQTYQMNTNTHFTISNNGVIAAITKTPQIDLEAVKANSVSRIASLIAAGLIKPNLLKGKLLYMAQTYNVADYADYLINLEDNDLYEALQRGLAGKCELINRDYLSQDLKNIIAASKNLYAPNAVARITGKTYPSVFIPIPGSKRLDGKSVKCLGGFLGSVCRRNSEKARVADMLRTELGKALESPSIDVCDLASVVRDLNKSQLPGINVDKMEESDKISYFKDGNQIRCFWQVDEDQAYTFGEGQVLNVEGQGASIELNPRTCKFVAYRKMRLEKVKNGISDIGKTNTWEVQEAKGTFRKKLTDFSGRTPNLDPEILHFNRHKIFEVKLRTILEQATTDKLDTLSGIEIGKITPDMNGPIEIIVDPRINPIPFTPLDYIGQMTTNFNNLNTSVTGLSSTVNNLGSTVTGLNSNVTQIGSNVDSIATSLQTQGTYTFDFLTTQPLVIDSSFSTTTLQLAP